MRIAIADDAALLREGLARLLADAGHEVVAQCADGAALQVAVDEHRPDLVVVDIRMPPTFTDEGARAALAIRHAHPGVGILVLSQQVEPGVATALRDTRGFGYLLKDRVLDVGRFLECAERIARGGTVLDPEVVAALVQRGEATTSLADLTGREREILATMAEGLSNAGIARRFVLTERTVESHVSSILGKLGLTNTPDDHRRVAAVVTYLRSGA